MQKLSDQLRGYLKLTYVFCLHSADRLSHTLPFTSAEASIRWKVFTNPTAYSITICYTSHVLLDNSRKADSVSGRIVANSRKMI